MIRILRGAAVAVLVVLLSACGSDEGYNGAFLSPPTAYVRVVNAIPNAPALTFEINDRAVGLSTFEQSTGFLEVLPELTLRFSAFYRQSGIPVTVIPDTELFIEIDHRATIVLTGSMENPEIYTFINPPAGSTADAATELEIQYFHAAPSRADETLTVELHNAAGVIDSATVAYGQSTQLTPVSPEVLSIEVRDSADTVIWQSGEFDPPAATRGLITVIDYFGPPADGVRAVSVTSASSRFVNEMLPSELRIANMTPDQGPLDFYIDGALFESNVPFGTVTGYSPVTPGDRTVSVNVFGDPATILVDDETLFASPGAYLTLVVTGLDGEGVAQFNITEQRDIASRLAFNFINAAPTFGTFDVYLLTPGTSPAGRQPTAGSLVQMPSTNSIRSIAVEQGTFDLVVTPSFSNEIVFGPERVDVVNGNVYSVYVTDAAGGGEPVSVVYADDF